MNKDRQRAPLRLHISPNKIAIALLTIAALIVVVGGLAHVFRHQFIINLDDPRDAILRRFDLVVEPSLLQWFSSSLHLLVSLASFVIARSLGSSTDIRWLGLSAIFLLASVDESIMIHELMDRLMRELFNTSGVLAIAWIIPGAFIALVIGLVYIPFLRSLDRPIAVRMIIAGVVFLCGAILMEIPGGYFHEQHGFDTVHYISSYAIEEMLETTGLILFIHALCLFVESQSPERESLVVVFSGSDRKCGDLDKE